jgi:hypothetical protein
MPNNVAEMNVLSYVSDYSTVTCQPDDAEIGIEIEVEANDQPSLNTTDNSWWSTTSDSSLWNEGREYIYRIPFNRKEVAPSLEYIQRRFQENYCHIDYTIRAGTHVHVNMQRYTMKQMMIFTMCYFTVENLLTDFCGEDRVGNLFCLRLQDAENLRDQIVGALQGQSYYDMFQENEVKYAACNFASLWRFGTVEFRAMGTYPNFERIQDWVNILLNIKDQSLGYENMLDIIEDFSYLGPRGFAEKIIGKENLAIDSIGNNPDFKELMRTGMRNVQDIVVFSQGNGY